MPDIATMLDRDTIPTRFGMKSFALVGGMAEYLYKRWALFRLPTWVSSRHRYLDRPFRPIG